MTEIEIKNFQSVKDIKFPIEGFTVIYGKNNIGKSAIIRAIKAALTNQTGKGFIRKGEKETEIRVKKDGLDIKWKKGTTAVYKINEKKYTKLNRDIPSPLIDAGYEKMVIGNKKVSPLIASQFKALFLIDEHGTTITEVLASLYNIDTLSKADDLCQKSLRSQKTLLKTREKDLKVLEEKIEKYADFEDIKKEVETLLEKGEQANKLESEITEIALYEERIIKLSESLNKMKPIKDIEIPDISKHEKDFQDIQELKELEQEYSKHASAVEQLKDITKITVPSTKDIKELSEEVKQLTIWCDSFIVLEEGIKQKKLFLDTLDIEELTKSYKTIESCCKEIVELEDFQPAFIQLIVKAKDTREELKNITDEYDEKYNKLSKEICPTCKRPYGN